MLVTHNKHNNKQKDSMWLNIRQVWVPALKKSFAKNDLKFVGFEADHVSVSQLEIFEDAFDTALIPTQNIVEKIREVKDEGEIQTIREACRISRVLHSYTF